MVRTTMSDYEDDLDEDLPSVSLSQLSSEKSQLEMPPASEVASQRAREEAAERALQDLREAYTGPRYISLSRSASQGSSGEEGEAALSAAVSALQVSEAQPSSRSSRAERLQLLTVMRDHLASEDAQFLDAYIHVLKEKPAAVDVVTERILRGISAALVSGRGVGCVCGVGAWLLGAALSGVRGPRVRRALRALLDARAAPGHAAALARAARAALRDGAEQLLAAHDAARSGARRGADALAATLLAHAMHAALARDSQEVISCDSPPSPLSSESVASVRARWRRLPAPAQLALLRCAGRALAAAPGGGERGERGDGGAEGGAALLAALAQPLPRASALHLDRQQVLTNVSKLQLLFRARFSPDTDNSSLENSQNSITEETSTEETVTMETLMKEEQLMKLDSTIKEETPIEEDPPVKIETSMKETMELETQIKQDKLIELDTTIKEETPIEEDPPVKIETLMKETMELETEIKQDKLIELGTTIKEETPIEEDPPVKIETLMKETIKLETQIKQDKLIEQETIMKLETNVEGETADEHSPERKRRRLERERRLGNLNDKIL